MNPMVFTLILGTATPGGGFIRMAYDKKANSIIYLSSNGELFELENVAQLVPPRETLAARYKQPVPKLIPAHWINNRWSQEWPGLVLGVDLDRARPADQVGGAARRIRHDEAHGLGGVRRLGPRGRRRRGGMRPAATWRQ